MTVVNTSVLVVYANTYDNISIGSCFSGSDIVCHTLYGSSQYKCIGISLSSLGANGGNRGRRWIELSG